MRVGLVQLRTPAAPMAGLDHAAPLVEAALEGGADLIVTPEGSNFLQRKRELFEQAVVSEAEDPFIAGMRAAARSHGKYILIGSALVRRDDGRCANRSILIGPDGERLAAYDKIHMFDVDLPSGERHRESSLYAPGDKAVMAATPLFRLGMTICYDLRFPHLYRALAMAEANVMTIPSAFTRPTGEAHWEVLLRARAIETGAFILAPAQGGFHEDGRATWGRSMAISPWGEILAASPNDEPGVIFADLDLSRSEAARAAIPSLANGREFTGP